MSEYWSNHFEAVLREQLPQLPADAPIDPDQQLADAGLNSLGVVRLLVRVEDEFGVSFPDDLITPEVFATPKALWSAVSGLVSP